MFSSSINQFPSIRPYIYPRGRHHRIPPEKKTPSRNYIIFLCCPPVVDFIYPRVSVYRYTHISLTVAINAAWRCPRLFFTPRDYVYVYVFHGDDDVSGQLTPGQLCVCMRCTGVVLAQLPFRRPGPCGAH